MEKKKEDWNMKTHLKKKITTKCSFMSVSERADRLIKKYTKLALKIRMFLYKEKQN